MTPYFFAASDLLYLKVKIVASSSDMPVRRFWQFIFDLLTLKVTQW